MINLRYVAARIIDAVTAGHSLTHVLETQLTDIRDARDCALVQAICYGVCRYYTRLDAVLSLLLKKPLKAKESSLHALLLVGLYQLMEMRIPPHAAVAETVNATQALKMPWARGLTNAILREYLREKMTLQKQLEQDEEAYYAHPAWLITEIKQAWPNDWQAILLANNTHPPFAVRVNQQRVSRADYMQRIEATPIAHTTQGLIVKTPMNAEELPGFLVGDVSVQDGAAQLASELLDLKPQEKILDACAAPGGKLTHLLEIEPQLASVVAVEKEAVRIQSIQENLNRLHLAKRVTLFCQPAEATSAWWDGQLFDKILLDAPCSASGVIRRHPDIKLLRQPEDIPTLAVEQLTLLNALWPLLKPGGMLVYVTCSIFPEENVHVLKQFFANTPDATEEKIAAPWGIDCEIGRQILPGMHDMDGFYFARMVKSAGTPVVKSQRL